MNDDDDDDDETRGEVSFKLVRGLRKSFPSLSFFFAKLASGIRNDGERSLLYEWALWVELLLIAARNQSIESWRLSFEISAEFIGICCLKICNGKKRRLFWAKKGDDSNDMFIFVRIESVKKRGNILKVFNFSSNLNIYRTSFHNWRKYIYSRINLWNWNWIKILQFFWNEFKSSLFFYFFFFFLSKAFDCIRSKCRNNRTIEISL